MTVDEAKIKDLPKIKFISQPDSFSSWMVGEIYQQVSPFTWAEQDWNHDGDVYEQKVAGFSKISQVNPHSPNYFYISEGDFKDLKWECCIEYVKEQTRETSLHLPLDEQIAGSANKKGQAKNNRTVSYER